VITDLESVTKITIPLPLVIGIGMGVLPLIIWLVNLESRIEYLTQSGSPTAVEALRVSSSIGQRVSAIEGVINQVSINTNRLTRVEAEIETLQRQAPSR
jgi:hypothetical protein